MNDLTKDELTAAAWAVAFIMDFHGYSSILPREGVRVDLENLYQRLTQE